MSLDTIGFYTLSEKRALNASAVSPMQRCEMILTDRCNFKCPYCRGLRNDCKGDLPLDEAKETLHLWCQSGLQNVRFSGGEPLTYAGLDELVFLAKIWGVRRIAISSNGSFPLSRYNELIDLGVNDFSISLDACCSALGDRMAGVSGQVGAGHGQHPRDRPARLHDGGRGAHRGDEIASLRDRQVRPRPGRGRHPHHPGRPRGRHDRGRQRHPARDTRRPPDLEVPGRRTF